MRADSIGCVSSTFSPAGSSVTFRVTCFRALGSAPASSAFLTASWSFASIASISCPFGSVLGALSADGGGTTSPPAGTAGAGAGPEWPPEWPGVGVAAGAGVGASAGAGAGEPAASAG